MFSGYLKRKLQSHFFPGYWRASVITLVLFSIVLASCSLNSSPQPSILVILVENLRFGSFSCGEGSESGRPQGLRAFCDEAVRFTHAYTPSVLSQATIASIITAKYPF